MATANRSETTPVARRSQNRGNVKRSAVQADGDAKEKTGKRSHSPEPLLLANFASPTEGSGDIVAML